MSDPYNSYPSHLQPLTQTPSTAAQASSARPKIDKIARLDVSEKWKARFRAIEKAGGPKVPNSMELSYSERRLINSNWLAFFFWPVYLPLKGLWRQALSYFIIAMALAIFMELVGLGRFSRAIGYGVGFLAAFRANIGYYKSRVLGEVSWL